MCPADADVYYRLFCKVLEDPSGLGHGRTGYYFTENGECVLYDIAKAIGTALVAAGVSNPHSVQVPALIKAAFDRKRAGVVGPGKALWPDVHIDDGESSVCKHVCTAGTAGH